jgi:hypothetical protein
MWITKANFKNWTKYLNNCNIHKKNDHDGKKANSRNVI